jgi:hypothetical protein
MNRLLVGIDVGDTAGSRAQLDFAFPVITSRRSTATTADARTARGCGWAGWPIRSCTTHDARSSSAQAA